MNNKTDQVKEDFAKRLHEAMDMENYPLRGRARILSKEFGISDKGAGKWLNGDAIPETSKIPLLADFLNVSSEWLLSGLSLDIDLNKAASDARAERLESWVTLHYKNQQEFVDKFELNQGEISNIIKKKRVLGERRARKLEQQTDIPPMYLEGFKNEELLSSPQRSQALEKLIHSLDTLDSNKQLSPELLKALETMVDVATSSANKENK